MVYLSFFEKKRRKVCRYEKKSYLCNRNRETNKVSKDAQMAESVDALVSNTSGAIRPGSTPGLGTKIKAK